MAKEKHNFAIYLENLDEYNSSSKFIIKDKDLVHRVVRVLRLGEGDQITFFNNEINVLGIISNCSKKSFGFEVVEQNNNQVLSPKITVALGVLKRENFETAIYNCVELGANKIQPIIFQKCSKQKLNYERLQKIIIAAAEQSKNFILPELCEPMNFSHSELVSGSSNNIISVYCDPNGEPALEVLNHFKKNNILEMTIIIGPEGDLTNCEKEILKSKNVLFMQLTPTILRSIQAVSVAVGTIRSCLH